VEQSLVFQGIVHAFLVFLKLPLNKDEIVGENGDEEEVRTLPCASGEVRGGVFYNIQHVGRPDLRPKNLTR